MAKLMKTVFLDLATIRSLLQSQSAVICADVTLPDQQLTARCSVFLRSEGEQICGCIIESGEGGRLLYSGEEALAKVAHVAAWQVYFTTSVEQALQDYMRRLHRADGSPLPLDGATLPLAALPSRHSQEPQRGAMSAMGEQPLRRLTATIPTSVLEMLSMKDRLVLKTVWAMVDGKRSLADIQAVLRLQNMVVVEAVESLRMFQLLS
jgi:hypothetical protein